MLAKSEFTFGALSSQYTRRALDHLIILHDRQLHRIVKEYLEHYHHERCHQGLDGQIILPVDQHQGKAEGPIRRKRRLGGLLNYYYRAVA